MAQAEIVQRMREQQALKQELTRLRWINQALRTRKPTAIDQVLQDAEERATTAEQQARERARQVLTLEQEVARLATVIRSTYHQVAALHPTRQPPHVLRLLARLRNAIPLEREVRDDAG